MHRLRRKRTRLAIALAAVLLVAAATAFGVAISADPPESGPAVHAHSDNADIWSVNVETGELTQRTLNADAREPTWSADGEIAFSKQSCDECLSEIHVDGPGSTEVEIDSAARHLYQPSWAPDGNRFAVVRLGRGIFAVDVAQGTAKQLTSSAADEAPAWSPAGGWIVFDRLRKGTYELYAVNAETGALRRLTHDSVAQTRPAWSPDGSRLAFAEQQSNGNWAIVTMGFDGNGRKRVTGSQISAQEPAWSPDGKKIAFILQELDRATVAVINADGTGTPKRLTDAALFPSRPTWSPGGTSIAFSATVTSP